MAVVLFGVIGLFLYCAIPTVFLAWSGKTHWNETSVEAFQRMIGFVVPTTTSFSSDSHHGGFWEGEGNIDMTADLDADSFLRLYSVAKKDPSFFAKQPGWAGPDLSLRIDDKDGVGFKEITFDESKRRIHLVVFRN